MTVCKILNAELLKNSKNIPANLRFTNERGSFLGSSEFDFEVYRETDLTLIIFEVEVSSAR